ncbi:glycoside hydrolase N-terminal domain-containing protein [Paenibacillus sp. D2_2]|nr:glycoside hydrolase N-terminal domain-containing protein [Paenibacillus sp. D2_2]WMT39046.1 glycoside hydrolase N-terminal domain-containing protein [Paenibacillus sp. D2_2]
MKLDEIRDLLRRGEVQEAEREMLLHFTNVPQYFGPYQPLGDLLLQFGHVKSEAEDYCRRLNLSTGVASLSYAVDGVRYQREIFVSAVHQVLVVRITASEPGAISLTARLSRRPFDGDMLQENEHTLMMEGVCGSDGVKYAAVLNAQATGGECRATWQLSRYSVCRCSNFATHGSDYIPQ